MHMDAIQAPLLRMKWQFVIHKNNRGEFMIHKHERLGVGI